MIKPWLSILLGVLLPLASQAIDQVTQPFSDSAQEQRFKQLTAELRCVVCQNQSLADSNADLAQNLRDEVRNMVLEGQNNWQIKEFLVTRYGDFVLYNPPVKLKTYVLWAGPLILLIVAMLVAWLLVRRRAMTAPEAELSAEERRRLAEVLQPPRESA